jgi:hypothetical protein
MSVNSGLCEGGQEYTSAAAQAKKALNLLRTIVDGVGDRVALR